MRYDWRKSSRPLHAEQVEVVRRLVEQEQVVLEGEQSPQSEPHGPAAREAGDGGVELGDGEAESQEDRGEVVLPGRTCWRPISPSTSRRSTKARVIDELREVHPGHRRGCSGMARLSSSAARISALRRREDAALHGEGSTVTSSFLMMDEPTNHLDIASRRPRRVYPTTRASPSLISHDEHFIRAVAAKVIEVRPAGSPSTRATTTAIST